MKTRLGELMAKYGLNAATVADWSGLTAKRVTVLASGSGLSTDDERAALAAVFDLPEDQEASLDGPPHGEWVGARADSRKLSVKRADLNATGRSYRRQEDPGPPRP